MARRRGLSCLVLLDSAGALAERAWHSSTVAQRSLFTSRCGSLGDPSARVFEVYLIVLDGFQSVSQFRSRLGMPVSQPVSEERRFSFLGLFSGFSPAFLFLFLYFSYTFLLLFKKRKAKKRPRKDEKRPRKDKKRTRKDKKRQEKTKKSRKIPQRLLYVDF